MKTVAVLCARRRSIYKTLPLGVDVFDEARDAFTFEGCMPVVAHPPCRTFGRLKGHARPENAAHERELALWCVSQVKTWGGVLEHPAASSLWDIAELPKPGAKPGARGFSAAVSQFWFGHRAKKGRGLTS